VDRKVGSALQTTYTADALNRAATLIDPQSRVTTYGYDATGSVTTIVTPTATSTATPTPTNMPTPTATNTPTPTPTLFVPGSSLGICQNLDMQFPTRNINFVIWYASAGPCAPTGQPDQVNVFLTDLGNALEDGYTTYFQTLQYQRPALSWPLQVYVVPILTGEPGISLPPGLIFIDSGIPGNPTKMANHEARSLGAHEFFHVVQWSYQQSCMKSIPSEVAQIPLNWFLNEDLRWWMEASADWA
jgi:YD repeat-containing protein